MIVEINVKHVIVLTRGHGMDKVIIHTNNLPATTYPWDEQGSLVMDVAKGQGKQYVIDNFGIEPEVIIC